LPTPEGPVITNTLLAVVPVTVASRAAATPSALLSAAA
jgi:hypothetical protein